VIIADHLIRCPPRTPQCRPAHSNSRIVGQQELILKILADAGLIRPKRIKQWTFFKRREPRIRHIKKEIGLRL